MGDYPGPEERARPKAKPRAKPRAKSIDIVRTQSTQYNPEASPLAPTTKRRVLPPTFTHEEIIK